MEGGFAFCSFFLLFVILFSSFAIVSFWDGARVIGGFVVGGDVGFGCTVCDKDLLLLLLLLLLCE